MRYTSILILTRMQVKFALAFFVSIMGAIGPTHFIFLNLVALTTNCLTIIFFSVAQQSYSGLDFLIIEASRTYSDTPNSVGLLWTSDQPDAETSIWHHTTLTTDMPPAGFAYRISIVKKMFDVKIRRNVASAERRRGLWQVYSTFSSQCNNGHHGTCLFFSLAFLALTCHTTQIMQFFPRR